jgi:hypothetical protein
VVCLSDLPDYRREIVIVESVTLDVTGSVTISATADVNLVQVGGVTLATPTVAACVPVSIENDAIAYDNANDRFKVDVEKWSATDTVDVNVTNASLTVSVSGTVTVAGSVTVSGTVAATQSGTWNIGTVTTVSAVTSITNTVTVSGSVTVSGTVAATQSGTWNIGTVTTITNTVTVSGSVTVSGTVAATQSGTWNIATLTSITNTVTVSVSGTVAISGAVTVSTAGGTNIIIDVLTQSAYLERRSMLSNNGVTPTWYFVTGNERIGKFFPRGARGFINTVDVYCRDAGSSGGTITVYLSPTPGMGAVASATITVSASGVATWRSATFNLMWKYDSLFIFIVESSAQIEKAEDFDSNFDCFASSDAGATWSYLDRREWFRALMKGETCGDLPVSGMVALSDRSDYAFSHITADAQVKAAYGRLHTVTINSCATAGTLTLYDNTAESGTVIAAIAIPITPTPFTLTFDVRFSTGLYAGFDATLAADVTISYI